jgi:hypothetical protein
MSSAAEAELGALFRNGQEGYAIRNTLEEMGHKQLGPTPIQTDNSTAEGIANDTVKAKRSKAMDMRFYWIRDRVKQGQFRVHWKPGSTNKADYHTNHHPPSHHIQEIPTYLQVASQDNRRTNEREGVLIRTRDSTNPSPVGQSPSPVEQTESQSSRTVSLSTSPVGTLIYANGRLARHKSLSSSRPS